MPSRRASRTSSREQLADAGQTIGVVSRLNEDGAAFPDGTEKDFFAFGWGSRAEIGIADQTLNLVID
jgi:hypothetical protein